MIKFSLIVILLISSLCSIAKSPNEGIETHFKSKPEYQLKSPPDKIVSLAVRQVFNAEFYDAYVAFKPEGSTFSEVFRTAVARHNNQWISFPKLVDDAIISKDLVKLLRKDFTLKNNDQALILLEALKDIFSIAAGYHDSRPNYAKVKKSGNHWQLQVSMFFDEAVHFKVITDNKGKVTEITFSLGD